MNTISTNAIRVIVDYKNKKMTESKIQKKIIDNFTDRGFLVIKLMKTNTNGIPDLLILKEGIAKFVEVKKPNGKISALQKYRIKKLRKQGFEAVVMDGIDSIIY